jgi:hypothetical protein
MHQVTNDNMDTSASVAGISDPDLQTLQSHGLQMSVQDTSDDDSDQALSTVFFHPSPVTRNSDNARSVNMLQVTDDNTDTSASVAESSDPDPQTFLTTRQANYETLQRSLHSAYIRVGTTAPDRNKPGVKVDFTTSALDSTEDSRLKALHAQCMMSGSEPFMVTIFDDKDLWAHHMRIWIEHGRHNDTQVHNEVTEQVPAVVMMRTLNDFFNEKMDELIEQLVLQEYHAEQKRKTNVTQKRMLHYQDHRDKLKRHLHKVHSIEHGNANEDGTRVKINLTEPKPGTIDSRLRELTYTCLSHPTVPMNLVVFSDANAKSWREQISKWVHHGCKTTTKHQETREETVPLDAMILIIDVLLSQYLDDMKASMRPSTYRKPSAAKSGKSQSSLSEHPDLPSTPS